MTGKNWLALIIGVLLLTAVVLADGWRPMIVGSLAFIGGLLISDHQHLYMGEKERGE